MDGEFDFLVTYQGKELNFEGVLHNWGYSYKITVGVGGVPVTFEPDEERKLRAVIPTSATRDEKIDPGLLQAIATTLENIGK
ncbi:MAG: hypothetical protein KGM98_07535 [Bacteroidota bacterium]|nr:hypothetical protein [Bacteroidota bacterium]